MPRNTVALGVRPPEPTTSTYNPLDPVRAFEGMAHAQNELNQARLFNQTFAAKLGLGAKYAAAPDEESGMEALRTDPNIAFAPELLTQARQAHLAMIQTAGKRQEMGQSAFENFTKMLPVLYADPSKWDIVKSQVLSGIYDPKVREQNNAQLDAYRAAMFAGTGGDPNKIRQNILGGMMSTLTPEQMKMYSGSLDWRDTGGGGSQLFYTPGIFGGGSPAPAGPPIIPGRGWEKVTQPSELVPPQPGGMQGYSYQPPFTPGPVGPPVGGAPAPNLVSGGALGVPAGSAGAGGGEAAPSPIQLPTLQVPPAPQAQAQPQQGPISAGQGLRYQGDREQTMAAHESALDDGVRTGQGLYKNMSEIVDAAKQAHLGGGADAYMRLGKILQGFGVNNKTVDSWANGSLSQSQIVDKLSLQDATGQMRTQLEGGGRYNMREFVAFLNSNPNITTDPHAMLQIFNLWNSYFQKDKAEQSALNEAKGKPGFDITKWPAQWAQSDYMKKFASGEPFTGEGVLGVLPNKARDGVFLPTSKQEFDEIPNGQRYRAPGMGPNDYKIKGEK